MEQIWPKNNKFQEFFALQIANSHIVLFWYKYSDYLSEKEQRQHHYNILLATKAASL